MAQQNERHSVAWRQFLVAKRAMLAEYDQASAHAREQPVSTHHGVVGEAAVRNWLGTFLPKRYGVASGFIRSQGFTTAHQTAHFDVIIYDQLDAPTLWIEVNKDKSELGRTRIIPAEHVRAILEVKAAFSRRTVREALTKLSELQPLVAAVDADGEKYPQFLPASAVLSMIFFELRRGDATDIEALNLLRDVELNRAFYGAVILRGEGLDQDDTALVQQLRSDKPYEPTISAGGLLHRVALTSTTEARGSHWGTMLMWADINFSRFAFDLLALLNGTYRSGFISSLHGLDFSGSVDQPSAE